MRTGIYIEQLENNFSVTAQATSITITHDQGNYPDELRIYDDEGVFIDPEDGIYTFTNTDANNIRVTFNGAFSGSYAVIFKTILLNHLGIQYKITLDESLNVVAEAM